MRNKLKLAAATLSMLAGISGIGLGVASANEPNILKVCSFGPQALVRAAGRQLPVGSNTCSELGLNGDQRVVVFVDINGKFEQCAAFTAKAATGTNVDIFEGACDVHNP